MKWQALHGPLCFSFFFFFLLLRSFPLCYTFTIIPICLLTPLSLSHTDCASAAKEGGSWSETQNPRPGRGKGAGAGGMSGWVSGGSRYSHIRRTYQRGCYGGCDYNFTWWDSKKKNAPPTTDHWLCPTILWLWMQQEPWCNIHLFKVCVTFSAHTGERKWFEHSGVYSST